MDNKNDNFTEGSLYGPHVRRVVPAATGLTTPGPVWERKIGTAWTLECLGPRQLMPPRGVVFRTKPSLVPLDGPGGIRWLNDLSTYIGRRLAESASLTNCEGGAPLEAIPSPPLKFDLEPPARVPAPSTPEKRTSAAGPHATTPEPVGKPRRPRQRYATNDPERVRAGHLIDTPAAADRIGYAPSTLRNLMCKGSGPPAIRIGRSIRFDPVVLDEWLAARAVKSSSQRGADD